MLSEASEKLRVSASLCLALAEGEKLKSKKAFALSRCRACLPDPASDRGHPVRRGQLVPNPRAKAII